MAYIALFIDNTSDMQEMAWFGKANPYQIGSNLPQEFKISIATIEANDWTSPFVIYSHPALVLMFLVFLMIRLMGFFGLETHHQGRLFN